MEKTSIASHIFPAFPRINFLFPFGLRSTYLHDGDWPREFKTAGNYFSGAPREVNSFLREISVSMAQVSKSALGKVCRTRKKHLARALLGIFGAATLLYAALLVPDRQGPPL